MATYYLLSFFLEGIVSTITPYRQIMLRNLGYSQSLVGIVMALGQVVAFFTPMIVGARIDKTGHIKKYFFLLSSVCVFAFWSTTFRLPFFLIAVSFMIAEGCEACFNPCLDSYLTNNLRGDSSSYGKIRATGTLGYVIILACSTLMGFPSETDNVEIITKITIINLIFISSVMLVPKYYREEQTDDNALRTDDKAGTVQVKDRRNFDLSVFDKSFYVMIAIVVFQKFGMSAVEMLLGSYMTEVLNLGNKFTLFVALGSFSEIFSLVIVGNLLKKNKVGVWGVLLSSCVALVLRLLLYAFSKSVWVFTFSQCLHSFTFGCNHIAVTAFIARVVDKKHVSTAMAIYWALGTNLTQLIGSCAGGFIIDYLGYTDLFVIYSAFPAVAVLLCFCFRKLIEGRTA